MVTRIALTGATGGTGKAFLKQALDAGYELKVLVRDPKKLDLSHSKLTIIKGDVLNPKDVHALVENTDLVVSLFGHVKGSPEGLQTNGTKNLIEAMKDFGVSRIISLSGGGLPFPEKDKPGFPDRMIRTIMKLFFNKILSDAINHAKLLAQSDCRWVIVRGSRLTNGEKRGTYRVGWVGVNAGTSISRADLADFILQQVEKDEFTYQMPFVSY